MAKVVNLFKTLRNHWKKTVFFTGLSIWGAKYGHNKYLEFNMMKAYCEEALKYGTEKIGAMDQNRHVTVVLNPVANKRKGKNDYEKYCAPLFHLAGMKVSLVITEEEGQVKDLMEIMDNTDCVVLAGGDGTVHEAITGLLRRKDSDVAIKKFPIGIIPIGKNNSIVYKLNEKNFDPKTDMKAKILAESSLAVIRQTLNKVDVMEIKGERGRPVYSIGLVNMGQIQSVLPIVDQYWYLGQRMKPYLAYFFQSFKDLKSRWDEDKEISIEYTKPCSGCSKCYQKFEIDKKSTSSWRWYHYFLPKAKPTFDPVKEEHRQMIDKMKSTSNEECDQWQTMTLKSKNIIIQDTHNNSIELIIHPVNMDRNKFINEGIRMFKNESLEVIPSIKVKNCRIHNTMFEIDEKQEMDSNKNADDNDNQQNKSISLDSKQMSSVKISLEEQINENRPKAIKELDDDHHHQNASHHLQIDNSINNNNEDNKIVDEKNNVNQFENNEINEQEKQEQKQDNTHWISIDNENYEMQSHLEISLLPRRVHIYHPLHDPQQKQFVEDNQEDNTC